MVHELKPVGKPTTCKEKLHCMEFGFIRGKLSTNHWVSSQIAGILKSAFRSAAPKGSMQYRAICRLRNDLSSLLLCQLLGRYSRTYHRIFNCYLCWFPKFNLLWIIVVMFGSVGTLELIGLCFKISCSKYH